MRSFAAGVPAEDVWGCAEDRVLIEFAARDQSAFAELYRRHVDDVYRYLLTYTHSEQDAADLCHHVFLRVLVAIPVYEDRGTPFRAWIIRIARNAAVDAFRHRRRDLPWDHLPSRLQPGEGQDPLSVALESERLNQLRVLLARLPHDRQELLALRFAARLTSAEIAAVIGGTEAAVQKRLTRTIRDLRGKLHGQV